MLFFSSCRNVSWERCSGHRFCRREPPRSGEPWESGVSDQLLMRLTPAPSARHQRVKSQRPLRRLVQEEREKVLGMGLFLFWMEKAGFSGEKVQEWTRWWKRTRVEFSPVVPVRLAREGPVPQNASEVTAPPKKASQISQELQNSFSSEAVGPWCESEVSFFMSTFDWEKFQDDSKIDRIFWETPIGSLLGFCH